MFSSSSQLKFWTFSGSTELSKLRAEANCKFVAALGCNYDLEQRKQLFLNVGDEAKVRRHYEYVLKEFCTKFQPTMPRYVLGTSIIFFKRFYLHNSVMDFHPKDMVYTCVYLACKVEEFNVSIMQFVANLKGGREKAADLILSQELLMMQQLHYHLTVHNPFRPLEGLFIDIKTRCPEVIDAEKLRHGAEEFIIERSLHTDVGLIFAPSQIALAALLHSANKQGSSLDSYVANKLLSSGGKDNLMKTVEHIKRIRYMVKNMEALNRDEVRVLEEKLERCRNQENNPESKLYKQKLEDLTEEDNDRRKRKRMKVAEERREEEAELLGL